MIYFKTVTVITVRKTAKGVYLRHSYILIDVRERIDTPLAVKGLIAREIFQYYHTKYIHTYIRTNLNVRNVSCIRFFLFIHHMHHICFTKMLFWSKLVPAVFSTMQLPRPWLASNKLAESVAKPAETFFRVSAKRTGKTAPAVVFFFHGFIDPPPPPPPPPHEVLTFKLRSPCTWSAFDGHRDAE